MTISALRGLLGLLVASAGLACGGSDPSTSDCGTADRSAALRAPTGVRPGEPYRWLARTWRSPLGLTIRTYGLAIDGVAIHGRHQVEIYDRRDTLVHRAGSGDAVLAALRARGPAAWASWRHPLASQFSARAAPLDPLVHTKQRAAWHYAHGAVVAAVATERVDLRGDAPVGERTVRDAVTGRELARHRTVFDLADPQYLVYAHDDGRPMSPLGDTFPHPTGVPDGSVPPPIAQQALRQSGVANALPDPWLPASTDETSGNNVIAFFNSLLDRNGRLADLSDAVGNETVEYGPLPDSIGNDFFANAGRDGFAFPYNPALSATEYFQSTMIGTALPPPDPEDVALNAKIVAAFYSTNWLHDFFYRAGFDEVAGNAQQSNLGRGGVACDPLIVHAGFGNTFTFASGEGESPVLELGLNTRSSSKKDQSVDFSVLSHEWAHYMIGRLGGGTGETDALGNLQGLALHEGLADFVGVLVNLDGGDDLHGAHAVGSYGNLDYIERRPTLPPVEARADAMYYGIRRYPYSLDFDKNPLTLRHLAEPPPARLPYFNWKGRGPALSEPHTTGEVFSQALFQCFGNIVAAHPGASFEELRARMAQYLVAGLSAFPDSPSLLDARDAFLGVIRLVHPTDDYLACRAGFAARGMGAGARGPAGDFGADPFEYPPYNSADIAESFVDGD